MTPITPTRVARILAAPLAPLVRLHHFLLRRDLPESAHGLILLAPIAAVLASAVTLVGILALAPALVLPFVAGAVAVCGVMTGVSMTANALIKKVEKHEDTTIVNTAGQRVRGSAYDLAAIMSVENEINNLTRRLDESNNPTAQEALQVKIQAAFTKASPHLARVTVIEDPEAPATADTTGYAFGIKRQQTVVQRAAAT